ncbi:MAG: GID complex subunit containing RING finger motif [Vezdaea acicularis]|nr:MAG: GID complex subunit containing RING finger motif [Vezdaea acicularis]
MADFTITQLNAESHLLLDQPLLRLPYELVRKNFQTARRLVEREREHVISTLSDTANASLTGESSAQSAASLDAMINRMQGLKRKLENLHEEEKVIYKHSRKRIEHLQNLYEIPSLLDVKYDEWSRIRLNRLLVDYMLRNGYADSAKALALDRNIEDLVDMEVFIQCSRIQESLKNQRTQECLAWCNENKQALKKINSSLEFELRLQQYIELVRSRELSRLLEARVYAQKFLVPHYETQMEMVNHAVALMAYPETVRIEPYATLYSLTRWDTLARLFTNTHHSLLSLPTRPLLHIALSAGLSSLKTPACHSKYASSSSNANSSTTSVCPICSTELNDLARNVPYAHHTKSHVENDPVLLPNGRIYGRHRLEMMSEKVGVLEGQVKDPTTGETFSKETIQKVYIS